MTKKTTHDKNPDFLVKKSSAGLGLFAAVPFDKGDFLIEYVGEKITHDEADNRGGRYLFTLNEKWVIDGKARDNLARYFNHSCEPNIEAVIEDDKKVIFLSLRDIEPGEELTFDYGKEYIESEFISKNGCKCLPCSGK